VKLADWLALPGTSLALMAPEGPAGPTGLGCFPMEKS